MRVVAGCMVIALLCVAPFVIWIYLITDDKAYRRRVKEREAGARIIARINETREDAP